jgi:pantothenate synthetase
MTTSTDSHDEENAVALLSTYGRRIEDLMAILSRGHSMSVAERAKATEMYRSLKDDLKEDCRRLSRKESQGEATHIESAFLLPAVCDASTKLRPATNTNPITSRWTDAVYDARIDIYYFLDALKK